MRAFFGSMTNRVFLTLLVGILLTAGLSQLLAMGERQRSLEVNRDFHALERAEQLINTADIVPAASRVAYLAVANRPGIRLEPVVEGLPLAPVLSEFAQALATRLGRDFQFQSIATKPPVCESRLRIAAYGPFQWRGTCESVNVRLRDGQQVRLLILPPRNPPTSPKTDFSTITALFVVCIAFLAYVVARMSTRPLARLAQAARDIGNDINHPPLPVTGANEIQQASTAFNAMQARIRQYISQRTQMLAAITHDLQTPLTRLRLRLEKVDDTELRERLIGDLSAMQEMVREGLDLARSTDTNEAMQPLDVDSLLDSVCSDADDAGQKVTVTGRAGMTVMGRPMALRRALVNLIDNAVKYGHLAEVVVERPPGAVRVRIRDNGPGIAEEELERVLEPFYRIESSRSRSSGGTGLGLTIARNIAEQHGGSLSLANRPKGGLEVTIVLPEFYNAR
jgi:signal transduction histidine kinase